MYKYQVLLDEIDADKLALRRKVEESLQRLEKETLISRSGDTYFFLTNEERDINREINLNKAKNYICLAEHIPASEDMLFIGNPLAEPPFSINLARYYRSQFFFAPRLVVLMDSLEKITPLYQYRWFISNNLDDDQIGEIEGEYGLTLVKKCGDFSLLQRPE